MSSEGVVTWTGTRLQAFRAERNFPAAQTQVIGFKRHPFLPQIAAHPVWLHLRFNLSPRDAGEMLLGHGEDLSWETTRPLDGQVRTSNRAHSAATSGAPGDVWYLGNAVAKCAGDKFWLW